MYLLNRNDEALALLRKSEARLFADPPPDLYVNETNTAALIGALLLRGDSAAHGRALLQNALGTVRSHVSYAGASDTAWDDVVLLTLLGQRDQAIATIETRLVEGLLLDLLELDHNPILAPLREDPRYEKALVPARARAAAQVKAARDAGLL